MDAWPYEVAAGISPHDAQVYCVKHSEWQKVRLHMKGMPTRQKLDVLGSWYDHGTCFLKDGSQATEPRRAIRELQVVNYLGALRRGGQLDAENKVKKEL